MPEIIGPFKATKSNVPPLEAHVGHLRHLANPTAARELLRREFGFAAAAARNVSHLFCAHIEQSIHFYEQSKDTSIRIRPVLQYYSYLNLAVAAILAYKPTNWYRYRSHGVYDKTLSLQRLDLASTVLEVQQGTVPLFHSILSDVDLSSRTFRLGGLVAGIHMLSHELSYAFGKDTQRITVSDSIVEDSGVFYSQIIFNNYTNAIARPIAHQRLEDAMPLLTSDYVRDRGARNPLIYKSIASWASADVATAPHRKNCMKLINYGGHAIEESAFGVHCQYRWHGVSRSPLLPTLTSLLLFSFSLASLVRYRPALLNAVLDSPYQLLIDTFVQESDGTFIPALRNLLYRQEVSIGSQDLV